MTLDQTLLISERQKIKVGGFVGLIGDAHEMTILFGFRSKLSKQSAPSTRPRPSRRACLSLRYLREPGRAKYVANHIGVWDDVFERDPATNHSRDFL